MPVLKGICHSKPVRMLVDNGLVTVKTAAEVVQLDRKPMLVRVAASLSFCEISMLHHTLSCVSSVLVVMTLRRCAQV